MTRCQLQITGCLETNDGIKKIFLKGRCEISTSERRTRSLKSYQFESVLCCVSDAFTVAGVTKQQKRSRVSR